jgi:hypothetical protein
MKRCWRQRSQSPSTALSMLLVLPTWATAASFTPLPIDAGNRKKKSDIWKEFQRIHPAILGALLDIVAHGLKALPDVTETEWPRMADFAHWATACERAYTERPLSNREREWKPREHGTLSSSPPCRRCSAQPLPGLWVTPFSARSLPRSVPAPFSAPHSRGTGADMDKDYLTLKRASASRPSGKWNDDDYDVLADGEVVGRIFKANAAPVGMSWVWK